MLTLIEEYNQWLDNYDILLNQLRAAYRFKNKRAINDINKRVLNTQVQISMCARALKKQGYADPCYTVSPSIGGHIQFPQYASMKLQGVSGSKPSGSN